MSRQPSKVPATLARPPERLVPPTTTAAMTASSIATPPCGSVVFSRAVCIRAATAAANPVRAKIATFRQPTRPPESSNARALSPIAWACRPNTVYRSVRWATAATATASTIAPDNRIVPIAGSEARPGSGSLSQASDLSMLCRGRSLTE